LWLLQVEIARYAESRIRSENGTLTIVRPYHQKHGLKKQTTAISRRGLFDVANQTEPPTITETAFLPNINPKPARAKMPRSQLKKV